VRPGIRLGLLLALLAAAAAGWAVDRHVDLTPRVRADFFFASDDPSIEPAHWIERAFAAGGPYLFVSVQGTDIRSPAYTRAVGALTERVAALPGVRDVLSITEGPDSPKRAFEGPMWRRLLVDEASQSTLIIASLPSGEAGPDLIARLDVLAANHSNRDLEVRVSGSPYVSGQIARHLARDLRTYTLASFALFGAMILLVFRSVAVLLGTLVTCGSAILLALLGNQLLGGSIGILTANLATIVFVLTQSHIVFLTANQRRLLADGGRREEAPWAAVRQTLPASFWCMLTTLLGFASLTFVAAEPLRALGRGGVAGTGLAAVCAYLLYPPFLAVAAGRRAGGSGAIARRLARAAERPWRAAGVALVALALALATQIPRLDTDPSLLAYFDPASEIHEGLAFIDRSGGTSILKLAVRGRGHERLDDDGAYERLWALQRDLESIDAVGAAVSLPVLVAEGRESSFLARLIGVRWLIELLSGDRADHVARSFVSESRREALYLMRMREAARERPRGEILDEMHGLARRAGLEVRAVGGIFFLQGRLARLVGDSLQRGLVGLLACFLAVGVIVARSLRVGLCMTVGIALVPLSLLGGLAALGVPVDLISSPASNVCIGMAADSMIHLVASVRRHAAAGQRGWRAWVAARREQGAPILLSTAVVCTGFSIFAFSSFPPNRRFGLAVVAGSAVAAAAALVLLPLLAGRPGAPAGSARDEADVSTAARAGSGRG
jgi:predicted RND superfamily exporter protein